MNITFTECGSCIVYIVLMIVAIFTGITVYLVYYNWYLINNNNNDDDDDDDDDDNHKKNKNLMNVIIKNEHNKTNKY